MVALRYSVLAVALLLALPISIGAWTEKNPFSAWPVYVSIATFAFSVVLLRREAQRDLSQLCVFWVLVGFVLGMLSLATLHDHPWIGWPALALSGSTWVASIVVLMLGEFAKDKTPNPMLQRFDKSQVFEVGGIQLACELSDSPVAPRGALVLLDHMRSNEFRYPCTVYLNPNADSAARCEREWFRGARVCYLDGDTLRWQGGVPRYTSIPDGTPVVERAG